ncbi:hypothetical protein ACWKWC_00575 [Geodermatophilus nigrescens]
MTFLDDATVARALGVYAAMVGRVLDDPERWLAVDDGSGGSSGRLPQRAADLVSRRALGEDSPASPVWARRPLDERVSWWVNRIGVVAGLAAATPRVAGVLSDRLPLQAALGASAAGLAVCAVAREHGAVTTEEWVPLLATVVLHRDVSLPTPVILMEDAERRLGDSGLGDEAAPAPGDSLGARARRSAATLWSLAGTMRQLVGLMEERPRGGRVARALAKAPVVGLAAGFLDERGGIHKAAAETSRLLATDPRFVPRRV